MSEPLSPSTQAKLISRQGLDDALQRNIEDNALPSETCSLGVDFGNHSSKMSIARKKGPKVQVYRVQLNVDFQHPESSNDHNEINNVYEFDARATLVDGRLVTGRQATASSVVRKQGFCLKTMFMYCAGITAKSTLEKAPGGRGLLAATEKGELNREMMVSAIEDHFTLLRDQALKRASLLKSRINTVVVTTPNFFVGREHENDYANLRRFYLDVLDKVWEDQEVCFDLVSEGQAVALYICEPDHVEDSDCLFDRESLFHDLEDLVEDGALNVKFFDSGGSTVVTYPLHPLEVPSVSHLLTDGKQNIQDITAYYRNDNTIWATQANVSANTVPGKPPLLPIRDNGLTWSTGAGALGGSNLSNSEVKHEIEVALQPNVAPEQLAEYMRKFEVWKWNVGDLKQDEALELVGTKRDQWVSIPAKTVSQALHKSFNPGLQALTAETERALALKKNCAFIFCGGSYRNPGLRKKIRDVRDQLAGRARKAGIRMKFIYLSNYDKTWVSAVSVGAALSSLKVPHPLEVFQGSALGLHMHSKTKGRWVDNPKADVIFSQKWGQAPPVRFDVPHRYKRARRLWLVCDPTYSKTNEGVFQRHRPIEIGLEDEVLSGPISTYQLDFMLPGIVLPSSRFAFSTFGPDLGRLSTGLSDGLPGPDSLTIGLHCYPIINERAEPNHPSAQRWHVTLKTAPSSRLLVAAKGIHLPVTCAVPGCTKQLQIVHQCLVCENYFVCDDCWTFDDDITHEHHSFEEVELAWAPEPTSEPASSEGEGSVSGDDSGRGATDDIYEFPPSSE